jgi:cyanophycin synthetase
MDIKQTKMLKLLDNCHPPSHKSTECDAHDPPTKKQQPPDNTFETVTADKFSQNNNLSQSSIISVTGTNGKTIVAQMITHILNEVGHTVKTKFENDQINKESAKDLNTVSAGATGNAFSGAPNEIFVLETSRQEILERGLIYEWSDISIITNIQPDVDESSEVESKNEVLQVKSLIAERVRKYGTLVLNADDELLMRLGNESRITQIEKKIVYFSLKPNHILLRHHISAGGTIYTIKNNWLVEVNQTGETRILEISDVPATFNGTAEFNVSNVLAAVAGCRAQNLSAQQIALALQSFQAPVRENNVASFL